jgi:hypothetical protein
MTKKEPIVALVEKEYKATFHKRCLDYDTTMTEVMKDAVKNFLESHPAKDSKYTGVT